MAVTLASAVTTTIVSGAPFVGNTWRITTAPPQYGKRTFQIVGSTSASTGTATAKIQVSNDSSNWIDLAIMTLTLGTAVTSDGFATDAVWENVRVYIDTAGVTGTDGSISVYMGV